MCPLTMCPSRIQPNSHDQSQINLAQYSKVNIFLTDVFTKTTSYRSYPLHEKNIPRESWLSLVDWSPQLSAWDCAPLVVQFVSNWLRSSHLLTEELTDSAALRPRNSHLLTEQLTDSAGAGFSFLLLTAVWVFSTSSMSKYHCSFKFSSYTLGTGVESPPPLV